MQYIRTSKLKLAGKRCLVRVDLNIKGERQENAFRLQSIIPTLRFLLRRRSRIIILSHLGRPNGKEPDCSLKPLARSIQKKIGKRVEFIDDLDLGRVREKIAASRAPIVLLENLRFHAGEEKNSIELAKKLAALGDIYINDAFAVSHRKNASICALARLLPAYGGLLLEKEIQALERALRHPRKPLALILGGAKISDKAGVIKYFKNKADYILVGGGVANTLLKSRGTPIGRSIFEKNFKAAPFCRLKNLILPPDWKTEGGMILDIGPKAAQRYGAAIKLSRTIIWSGPMGMFEKKKFSGGTSAIWEAIRENKSAHAVIGGGETVASLNVISGVKLKDSGLRNIFISTGGGAMLDYLSGMKLPGLMALEK